VDGTPSDVPEGFVTTMRILLGDIKETKTYSDVVLISSDGTRLQCHRTVLALSSSFLKTLLDYHEDEPDETEVFLSYSSADIGRLLEILYLGSVKLTAGQREVVYDMFRTLGIENSLVEERDQKAEDNFERLHIVEEDLVVKGEEEVMEEEEEQLVDIVKIQKVVVGVAAYTKRQGGDDSTVVEGGDRTITRFICNEGRCRKSFSRKYDLIAHQRLHTGERPYPCQFCDERFVSVTDMRRHMLRVHNHGEKVACKQCGKTFRDSHNLKNHMSVHTGLRPFVCAICPSAFSQKSDLMKHGKIHSDDQPFQCDVCLKTFKWKHILGRHKMTHTGEKPFDCDCGMSFRSGSDLQIHQRTHTGEKRYECQLCGHRFARKDYLNKHMTVHRKPTLSCPVPLCNAKFYSKADLGAHEKTVHDRDEVGVEAESFAVMDDDGNTAFVVTDSAGVVVEVETTENNRNNVAVELRKDVVYQV